MPTESAVRVWAREKADFGAQYACARELGYEVMGDDIVAIADEGQDVNRDRLRVDSRKWLLSKMLPKTYGDKVEQTIVGPASITISETDSRL